MGPWGPRVRQRQVPGVGFSWRFPAVLQEGRMEAGGGWGRGPHPPQPSTPSFTGSRGAWLLGGLAQIAGAAAVGRNPTESARSRSLPFMC